MLNQLFHEKHPKIPESIAQQHVRRALTIIVGSVVFGWFFMNIMVFIAKIFAKSAIEFTKWVLYSGVCEHLNRLSRPLNAQESIS